MSFLCSGAAAILICYTLDFFISSWNEGLKLICFLSGKKVNLEIPIVRFWYKQILNNYELFTPYLVKTNSLCFSLKLFAFIYNIFVCVGFVLLFSFFLLAFTMIFFPILSIYSLTTMFFWGQGLGRFLGVVVVLGWVVWLL